MADITPYQISVPEARITDLKQRLELAIFPDELDEAGWDYGSPLADVKKLTAYWKDEFDWRKSEDELNRLPQFTTSIQCDGFEALKIHFVHQKSDVKGAIPLLFVHGWPGSFIEVSKIIDGLTKGGDNAPSFDVVGPSLPNYGFSEGTKKKGFGLKQYAETCNKLMLKLGYDQYVTQGGDWGTMITRTLSLHHRTHCLATHLNMDISLPPTLNRTLLSQPLLTTLHTLTPYTPSEKAGLARTHHLSTTGLGYLTLQSSKPQTLGYSLATSPVGLLAYLYEKLHDWTDSYPWTPAELCTWFSLYWFSTAGPAASLRIYYESLGPGAHTPKPKDAVTRESIVSWIPGVKVGVSHFPLDLVVPPSKWCRTLGPVVFERRHERGGHFAAWEVPELLVGDVREMFGRRGGGFGVVGGRDGYK